MISITREVRFSLSADRSGRRINNSWGGWPPSRGICPYLELRVTVAGPVDRETGYLCNITTIDAAVRNHVIPPLADQYAANGDHAVGAESALAEIRSTISGHLPAGVCLECLELAITPRLRYAIRGDGPMVTVTQSFEFSAAHRLYCKHFSDEENRRVFGKCANPTGHGHNYVIEVSIAASPESNADTGTVLPIDQFERIVKDKVIDPFDHKHLNIDCEEFADLNPSVENITRVIWSKLEGAFDPVRLTCVRLYETPKTWAEYRGE